MKTVWHIPCYERFALLKRECEGRRVLDLGFAAHPRTEQRRKEGNLLSDHLLEVADRYVGVDKVVPEGFFEDRKTYAADLQDPDDVEILYEIAEQLSPEVIVAAELLEHLPSPGVLVEVVATLCGASWNDTVFIVTVPNAMSAYVDWHARHQQEVVHEGHVAWYSPSTLSQLLGGYGLFSEICGYPSWNPAWKKSTRCFGLIAKARVAKSVSAAAVDA